MNENINKPFSMVVTETKNTINKALVDSGLNVEILHMIMSNITNELKIIATEQAIKEQKDYEQALIDSEKKKEERVFENNK